MRSSFASCLPQTPLSTDCAGMATEDPSLLLLPTQVHEKTLHCLHARDLASVGVCCKALRDLLRSQPETLWRAAVARDPVYPRQGHTGSPAGTVCTRC